jgi:hypothetical protein
MSGPQKGLIKHRSSVLPGRSLATNLTARTQSRQAQPVAMFHATHCYVARGGISNRKTSFNTYSGNVEHRNIYTRFLSTKVNFPHLQSHYLCDTFRPVFGSSFAPFLGLHDHTHLDTPHWVELLWTSDQPDAETSTSTHNTHKRQTSMPLTGFEPIIPASERPKTHASDCAATGIGLHRI